MPQSKSRLDIPWPNDAECIGLCPVLFVIRVPTTLWCRVPSLPRCWLGVHIRLMYCTRTPLPATQEWKWAGLKWSHAKISKWKVRPPLPWSLTFRLSGVTSQTILGNPTPEVVEKCIPVGSSSRSPELGGLCRRKRLSLWGGVALGAWMTLGVGHGPCILSEVGFQPQDFETQSWCADC